MASLLKVLAKCVVVAALAVGYLGLSQGIIMGVAALEWLGPKHMCDANCGGSTIFPIALLILVIVFAFGISYGFYWILDVSSEGREPKALLRRRILTVFAVILLDLALVAGVAYWPTIRGAITHDDGGCYSPAMHASC